MPASRSGWGQATCVSGCSRMFAAGHRIRITVAGADRENARTPRLTPAPTLTVWRQPGRMSWVDLPVIPPS
jgi:uncharacterized protein